MSAGELNSEEWRSREEKIHGGFPTVEPSQLRDGLVTLAECGWLDEREGISNGPPTLGTGSLVGYEFNQESGPEHAKVQNCSTRLAPTHPFNYY